MAYEQVIQNLEAAEAQTGTDLADFVALINKYASMGLIIQVHSHQTGDVVKHTLHLIYRPSTSVEITKVINDDGAADEWKVYDLTEHA
jgi:hypothetical protein